MAGAVLIDAACLALAVAAVVVVSRSSDVSARFRRGRHAVLAVALLVQVVVMTMSAARDSANVASRLEKTEAKLLQMEEILQDYEKHNQDMVSNLAAMLSKNPGNIKKMSYNKARSPDGSEKAELTVTIKDSDNDQPLADYDDHTADELIKDEVTKSGEDAQAGTPSPSPDGTTGKGKEKPWRLFWIPPDHVFVLDCADDGALTVHIRPRSAGSADEASQASASCSSRRKQQAAAAVAAPFLYDCGKHRTLFLPPRGKERFMPVPWPRAEMFEKVKAAALRGKESPVVRETAVPESFALSPDVAVFYRPAVDGMTELLIAATEVVEYKELAEKDKAVRAWTALTPPTVLPTSFPDYN